MPNGERGARAALAGYLYQIAGALGIATRVSLHGDASGDELEALVEIDRTAELHHERLGQDVVLATLGVGETDHLVLVQFKYSQRHPVPALGPADLREIADRMLVSKVLATERGAVVTGYVLVTNRQLGPGAAQLVDSARQGLVPTEHADERRWDVLSVLRLITDLRLVDWQTDLDRFGRSFGALQDEILQGVNALIGDLLQRTVGGVYTAVTGTDLVQAFARHREAGSLMWSSLIEQMSTSIAAFRAHAPGEPLRRQVLDDIRRAASERALVVVCGDGGCGKTVALSQWAREVLYPDQAHPGSFAAISVARWLPHPWPATLMSGWQHLPPDHPRCHESNDVALLRLRRANPESPEPLLCLALDGLDEDLGTADRAQFVRDTVAWFWQEDERARSELRLPRATLVVTLREAGDVDQLWLTRNPSGFEYAGHGPPRVQVGDFSPDELLQAAETALPNLAARIAASLVALSGPSATLVPLPAAIAAADPQAGAQPAASLPVVEALMHPVMWRSLLQVEPAQQSAVLDGDGAALRLLADQFIRRFHNKVSARGRGAGLAFDQLIAVLTTVARRARDAGGETHTLNEWADAAASTGLLKHMEARSLFNEALQAGMVLRNDAAHWRWRHALLADYLTWDGADGH